MVEKIIVSVWSVKPVYYSCCIIKAGKLCYNVILFPYKQIITIKMRNCLESLRGVCGEMGGPRRLELIDVAIRESWFSVAIRKVRDLF